MGDLIDKQIDLLKSNSPIELIKQEMNLTNNQLAYRLSLLKNMGYTV